jgi:hypothetical protein
MRPVRRDRGELISELQTSEVLIDLVHRSTPFSCRRVLQGPLMNLSTPFSRALKDAPTILYTIFAGAWACLSVNLHRDLGEVDLCKRLN